MFGLATEPRIRGYAPSDIHSVLTPLWEVRKYRGDPVPHNLLGVLPLHGNMLCNGGQDIIWRTLTDATKQGSNAALKDSAAYLGVGTSSTPTVATMTDLQGTNTRSVATSTGYTVATRVAQRTWSASFGSGVANFDWNELGMFDASSAGRMFNRAVQFLGTKVSGQTWTVNLSLGFSQSPHLQSFVSDIFQGTASLSMLSYVSPNGGFWVRNNVSTGATVAITATGSGVYSLVPNGSQCVMCCQAIPATANYAVDLDFQYAGTSTNASAGVCLRAIAGSSSSDRYAYICRHNRNTSKWEIQYNVPTGIASPTSALLASSATDTIGTGTIVSMRALIVGNTISIYKNGVLMISAVDTNGYVTAANRVGFTIGNHGNSTYTEANSPKIMKIAAYNLWQ